MQRLPRTATSQHHGLSLCEEPVSNLTNYKSRIRDEVMTASGVVTHSDEPIQLASGELSRDFIDGKLAVADPDALALVGAAMFAAACDTGVEFDAVGGLLLGAVPFTFAVAGAARCEWFIIRKEKKGRGTNRVVEDGAEVVFATTLVDRGEQAAAFFEKVAVPYRPILTYGDLGIVPVGDGPRQAAAAS
jgi:orotate phosphoribosyltransferase